MAEPLLVSTWLLVQFHPDCHNLEVQKLCCTRYSIRSPAGLCQGSIIQLAYALLRLCCKAHDRNQSGPFAEGACCEQW